MKTPQHTVMVQAVSLMFQMQAETNDKLFPGWRTANLDYPWAAVEELVECRGYLGWEWWKKPKTDRVQALLELVDAIHFLMSLSLAREFTYSMTSVSSPIPYDDIAECFIENDQLSVPMDWETSKDVVAQCLKVAVRSLTPSTENVVSNDHNTAITTTAILQAWVSITRATQHLGFSPSDLISLYIGKTALNRFRGDNGYREGTYIKHWGHGKEDNFYLADLVLRELPPLFTDEMPDIVTRQYVDDGVAAILSGLGKMYESVKKHINQ